MTAGVKGAFREWYRSTTDLFGVTAVTATGP